MSPVAALKLIHESPCFDVVISDVVMPRLSGPELVMKIYERCPDCRVVMISGYKTPEVLPPRAQFLSKPFRLTDLLEAVQKALQSTDDRSAS